jgi:type II secretory pathway component PulJ
VKAHRDTQGVTLLEVMLVMVITALIFGITQALLASTIDSWWKVNANADAQQQLYKAQSFIERDLEATAYEREPTRETIGVEKAPSALVHLDGSDSDVLWFLSAIDPVSGRFQRKTDGQPFWQRNILYYAVTPTSLNSFGYLGAGTNVDGYESACPFKVLIRKEIDFGTPTIIGDEGSAEPLMTFPEIVPYLNRPNGYDTSNMSAPAVSVRPISGNILTFRADFSDLTGGIRIDLRATAIDRAKREGQIDTRDLSQDPATQQLEVTLFPPNRQGSDTTNGAVIP